ncbi:MAG: hypothetical protein LC685_00345 [Actinobacteria bacterium]|nr:hypothetical protein [Actinomycetota bacterium]
MPRTAFVAVTPPEAAAARSRLFEALEQAFRVRFERREASSSLAGVDAVLAFDPLQDPRLPRSVPALVFDGRPLDGAPSQIAFTDSAKLDRRLRGRTLRDSTQHPRRLEPLGDSEVLASRGGAPVWARRHGRLGGEMQVAASAPQELHVDEPLKARLQAGNFESLLPLVHFLRNVCAPYDWEQPPLRAMLMFDDPNLHWPTYGHIDYRDLLRRASRHGYHAAMGMIPLDAALAHPTAARLYREHPERLSLLMHGLMHVHKELMQPRPPVERARAVARALRSVEGFERRSGVSVSRVMVAPYGEASEEYLSTLLSFGMEAQFADLPFPWRAGEEPRGPALTYWHPVNFVAGGMPVIPRYPLTYERDEVVLRAFLGHPLVLYGHHEDVARGLAELDDVAALVNSLGPVQWGSAATIARTNFATLRQGDVLAVRLLARRVDIEVPPDVESLELDLSLFDGDLHGQVVRLSAPNGHAGELPAAPSVAVEAPTERLTIEVGPRRQLDRHSMTVARLTPWPLVRRALTESRDRLRPLYG